MGSGIFITVENPNFGLASLAKMIIILAELLSLFIQILLC